MITFPIRNFSFEKSILILLGLILLGYAFSTLLVYGILIGLSHYIPDATPASLLNNVTILKWYNVISSICTFAIPALITNQLCNIQSIQHNENKVSLPYKKILFFGCFIGIIVLFPLINYLSIINMSFALPSWASPLEEWMRNMEEEAQALSQRFLLANNLFELFLNIVIIAFFPAITEEILFRGSVQQLIYKHTHKGPFSIWFTAFIFSIAHLQFYTFIPRFLLGGYLGYLYLHTKRLYIPIAAHFTNNMLCVCLEYAVEHQYIDSHLAENLGSGDTIWVSFVGLIFFCIISYLLFVPAKHINAPV